MLSKPNVKEVMPKVGNRYQSVLALAKRARQIESDRLVKRAECKEKNKECKDECKDCVYDAVNRASEEISEGKVYIKIDGEYAVTPESEMEKEIKEAQEEARLAQENKE